MSALFSTSPYSLYNYKRGCRKRRFRIRKHRFGPSALRRWTKLLIRSSRRCFRFRQGVFCSAALCNARKNNAVWEENSFLNSSGLILSATSANKLTTVFRFIQLILYIFILSRYVFRNQSCSPLINNGFWPQKHLLRLTATCHCCIIT